jgi:hypothetical protein
LTEHNHRRGTRARGGHNNHGCGSWGSVPAGYCRFAQRYAHRRRRGLVHKLLTVGKVDDIPGNTPRHIRWDYW